MPAGREGMFVKGPLRQNESSSLTGLRVHTKSMCIHTQTHMPEDQNTAVFTGLCCLTKSLFHVQIKTENLNDSPHSVSSHKTCHLTQGSPVPGGQLTGVHPYKPSHRES